MSYPLCQAPVALAAQVNMRAFSGAQLFRRGAGPIVSAPDFSAVGAGLYRDAIDFLNGRGVVASESWPVAIATPWTGAGTITMGIDAETGRVFIESTAEDFAIDANAFNEVLGFDVAGHGLVGGVAPFRRVAPAPFELGPILNPRLDITPAVEPGFAALRHRYHSDVITAMRAVNAADKDATAATTCLQHLDEQAYGPAVRWFVDGEGYCVNASVSADAFEWLSIPFRDALGFTGRETLQADGLVRYLRAERPMPGVLVFPDGLDDDMPGNDEVGAASELIASRAVSLTVGHQSLRRLTTMLDGPLATVANHRHALRFLKLCRMGRPVTLYRSWGDPRRFLEQLDITAEQPAHDLVYTSDPLEGRGRLLGHRAAKDSRSRQLAWESGLRQHARFEMLMREDTDAQ